MKRDNQLALSVQLPDDETFDSFIGETNITVASILADFVKSDVTDQNTNSFYIFGAKGVGKSHLLHAACALAETVGKSSLCLSMAEVKYLSVELLESLESIDLICIDDIHLIADDEAWQQAIFDLFNRLKEQGKQIIITGFDAVNDIKLTLPDLQSRLSWGLIEQLKQLSDDEKLSAVQYRAVQRGLTIHLDVIKYLFNHFSRDMAVLIAYLDTLDRVSIREQRKITIPFIKQVLPKT